VLLLLSKLIHRFVNFTVHRRLNVNATYHNVPISITSIHVESKYHHFKLAELRRNERTNNDIMSTCRQCTKMLRDLSDTFPRNRDSSFSLARRGCRSFQLRAFLAPSAAGISAARWLPQLTHAADIRRRQRLLTWQR